MTTKNNIFLSIIIPAYNEEKRIGDTLFSLKEYFKNKNYPYEVIVVNDGSKDNTENEVLKFQKEILNLKIINNNKNSGKGYAVKKGMLEAKGDFKLFMDADNSVKIDNLDIFLAYAKKDYDIVIASIKMKNSEIKEENIWYRKLLGDISKYIIRLIAVSGVYDTQRGFKLFSKKAADAIFPKQTIKRWGFDVELIVIAKLLNFKIKELPVKWDNPKGSKVTFFSYLNTLLDLIKIKLNILFNNYSDK